MSVSFQKELYAYRVHLRTELTTVEFVCIIHTHNFEMSILYLISILRLIVNQYIFSRYSHVDILVVVFDRQSSNLIKDTYFLLSIFLRMYSYLLYNNVTGARGHSAVAFLRPVLCFAIPLKMACLFESGPCQQKK